MKKTSEAYYLSLGGKTEGPLTSAQIRNLIHTRKASMNDMVYDPACQCWRKLEENSRIFLSDDASEVPTAQKRSDSELDLGDVLERLATDGRKRSFQVGGLSREEAEDTLKRLGELVKRELLESYSLGGKTEVFSRFEVPKGNVDKEVAFITKFYRGRCGGSSITLNWNPRRSGWIHFKVDSESLLENVFLEAGLWTALVIGLCVFFPFFARWGFLYSMVAGFISFGFVAVLTFMVSHAIFKSVEKKQRALQFEIFRSLSGVLERQFEYGWDSGQGNDSD